MEGKGQPASHGFTTNPYLEVFHAPPSAARTSSTGDSVLGFSDGNKAVQRPGNTLQVTYPDQRQTPARSSYSLDSAATDTHHHGEHCNHPPSYSHDHAHSDPRPSAPHSPSTVDVTFRLEPLNRNRIVGGYACEPCKWTFKRKVDLTAHWRTHPAHAHDFCPICKVLIKEDRAVHWRLCHAICALCGAKAMNQEDLLCHERLDHLFCYPCNRYFQSVSQMAAHLGSERHRISTVKCLLCGYLAGSVSIMLAHLEFGKCISGFRKVDMGYFIAAYDQFNKVFSDDYQATSREQRFHPPCGCFIASEARSDGYVYACFFCEMKFTSLDQINRHLGSPVHNGMVARSYRCPGTGCGERKYESMSALVLHIESAGCDAYGMPEVIKALDNLMSGFQGLTLSGR